MGNAPLPSPPASPSSSAGSKKVVWSITTGSKIFGTRLRVVGVDGGGCGSENAEHGGTEEPPSPPPSPATAEGAARELGGGGEEEETAKSKSTATEDETASGTETGTETETTDIEASSQQHRQQHQHQQQPQGQLARQQAAQESEAPEESEQDQDRTTNGPVAYSGGVKPILMPPLLRNETDLSPHDYSTKFEEFVTLLDGWRGGVARLLILIWVVVFVLTFVCAYFVPGFWQSVVFSTPIYLPVVVVVQFTFLAIFGRYERVHNRRLLTKTNALFDDWLLRHRIHVKFYRVANLAASYVTTRNGLRRQKHSSGGGGGDRSGNFCFVLVMTVVSDEEALAILAPDDGTVGMSVGGGGGGGGANDDGTHHVDDGDRVDVDYDNGSLDNDSVV